MLLSLSIQFGRWFHQCMLGHKNKTTFECIPTGRMSLTSVNHVCKVGLDLNAIPI